MAGIGDQSCQLAGMVGSKAQAGKQAQLS